jgi:hypothetical protein
VQASVVPFNAVPNALVITVNEFPEFAEMLARRSSGIPGALRRAACVK